MFRILVLGYEVKVYSAKCMGNLSIRLPLATETVITSINWMLGSDKYMLYVLYNKFSWKERCKAAQQLSDVIQNRPHVLITHIIVCVTRPL